jgi:hypothetical protein
VAEERTPDQEEEKEEVGVGVQVARKWRGQLKHRQWQMTQ